MVLGAIIKKVGKWPLIAFILSFIISFVFEKVLTSTVSLLSDILRGLVVATIASILVANIELYKKVNKNLTDADIKRIRIDTIRSHIHKDFLEIFDDYFDSVLINVESAVQYKKITIYTNDQFRDFYIRVLRNCPNTTFYATSLVHKNYFWREKWEKGTVEYATMNFTQNGGRFVRIFFISDDDKSDIARIQKVFEMQKKMGVSAYCLESDDSVLEKNDFRLILVAENRKFAWEVHLGQDSKISKVEITVNPTEVTQYIETFDKLKNIKSLKSSEEYLCYVGNK